MNALLAPAYTILIPWNFVHPFRLWDAHASHILAYVNGEGILASTFFSNFIFLFFIFSHTMKKEKFNGSR